jgi:hypothetical protein
MSHLEEIEAIRQLKARYCRFMDTKDWESWRGVFTDDVVVAVDTGVGKIPPMTGADGFVRFVRERNHQRITVHHGHTSEIEITSPTTATGIWGMEDIVEQDDGTLKRAYGFYHETYRRDGNGWRIASIELRRVHTELGGPWRRT